MFPLFILKKQNFCNNFRGWLIFNFSILQVNFVFCELNFIVFFPFFIKYYHIIFIIILFWSGSYRPAGLLFLFHARFVLLHSCCPHARFFGETTRAWVPIFYSHTEWYLLISRSEIVRAWAEASPIKIWWHHYFYNNLWGI